MQKGKTIQLPMTEQDVLGLRVGEIVFLNGKIVTGRDKIHQFLCSGKKSKKEVPFDLRGTVLYHCGPLMKKTAGGFECVAGGPTTSMRLEMYEPQVISEYGLRGVMGKGGMGSATLNAMKENGCVYFQAFGGAAVYLSNRIKKVAGVWKLEEFGMTEAMWLLDVVDFPAILTMDAHGKSLHAEIEKQSADIFKELAGLR
ncbi:MAG: FumA C-terminus/TtdB family hydratase beta subunit [Thermodesulfovibrionales bacterium]|nr:FumA C-terminus/TtdB family hydratase beta subunit [Thermodesulfovibrionales bacterium]